MAELNKENLLLNLFPFYDYKSMGKAVKLIKDLEIPFEEYRQQYYELISDLVNPYHEYSGNEFKNSLEMSVYMYALNATVEAYDKLYEDLKMDDNTHLLIRESIFINDKNDFLYIYMDGADEEDLFEICLNGLKNIKTDKKYIKWFVQKFEDDHQVDLITDR